MASKISNTKKYMCGTAWGKDIAEKKIKKGLSGLKELTHTRNTCSFYSFNRKITQTKHGEYLSKSDRDFYRGAMNGIDYVIRKKY